MEDQGRDISPDTRSPLGDLRYTALGGGGGQWHSRPDRSPTGYLELRSLEFLEEGDQIFAIFLGENRKERWEGEYERKKVGQLVREETDFLGKGG